MCVSLQTVKHLCKIPLCYWCESVWLYLVMQKETPHMKNAILQLTPGWRWWRWWWCLSGLSVMKYKHTTVNEWKNRSLMCEHSDTQCERFNTSVASVATFFRAKMLFTRNSTSVEKKTDSSFLQIIESYQSAPAPMSHISISTAVYIGHVRRVNSYIPVDYSSPEKHTCRNTRPEINTFNKLKLSFKTGRAQHILLHPFVRSSSEASWTKNSRPRVWRLLIWNVVTKLVRCYIFPIAAFLIFF